MIAALLLTQLLSLSGPESPAPDPLAGLHLSAALPAGWNLNQEPDQKPNIVMFVNGHTFGDSLLFQSTDAQNQTLAQAVENAKHTIGIDDYRVSKPYRICNGTQDAWYMESAPVTGIVTRSVVTVTPSRWSVVTYMHLPQFGEPDTAALHALDSVCAT